MPDFPKKLAQKLQERVHGNCLRELESNKGLIDFSSNDYLGFSKEEEIHIMAREIEKDYDFTLGSTGSRLLSGNHPIHEKLESFLAKFHKSEAALVFNSGYDANLGFFASVPQRNDLVFYDELCHASIRDGIQLGNAKSYKFKHSDLEDLIARISSFRDVTLSAVEVDSRNLQNEIYVVTESVFSMDGDSPDLKTLASFCTENNIHLVVDEAHALGVFGKGLVNELGLGKEVFARIITFGKALGSHGAAILGPQDLIDYLVNFARSFIYTTALPTHTIAHILAAYGFLQKETGDKQITLLKNNIKFFNVMAKKMDLDAYFNLSESAVQVCMIGGNDKTKQLSQKLRKKGFDVRSILSPTVPKEKERLRFCIHAFNTKHEIEEVLKLVKTDME